MGKRKIFLPTDLSVPHVEHSRDAKGVAFIIPEATPPHNTVVHFGRNCTSARNFDFAPWYGTDIDSITYAFQKQIERFLVRQESDLEIATVTTYCSSGVRRFLSYMLLRSVSLKREITLADINRSVIDGYLYYLKENLSASGQSRAYNSAKSILWALGKRGIIDIISIGDNATFPKNAFPNINKKLKSEPPLSGRERREFSYAIKQAIIPIWKNDVRVTGELLTYALLIIALHTGRNTTPLLEMDRNCLHAHPKENHFFLTLWKRRGHNSNKVVLKSESTAERLLESTPTVKTNIERLIRRVLALTEPLVAEAPKDLKERAWLYRSRTPRHIGEITSLNTSILPSMIKRLVSDYGLIDNDGVPLRINISRLRKTFANRIFELTDGDLATTAIALGNTQRVTSRNYLAPSDGARRNWKFMGEILIEELLTSTIGASYKTIPTGRCGDPLNGQYAPKRKGAVCFSFLNCMRCSHFAVTTDDLHRLFSFYFRVLAERNRIAKRTWEREYAQIPRLIDTYIVAEGLRRGTFKPEAVESARERAKRDPHPFWSFDLIESLGVFA